VNNYLLAGGQNNISSLVTCTWVGSFDSDAIMGEVLNVIVAFAVIVFAVRWATKGPLHSLRTFLLVLTPPI